jgi:two-component system OmpR family response regulator
MTTPTILVVDDDAPLREVVRYALARDGFDVLEAGDGERALALCRAESPDLVVLDINLPRIDGLSVCRELRRRSAVSVLFVSCRRDEVDRILGFDHGGDDYVTKPFSPRELVRRVRAILRRTSGPAEDVPDLHWQALRLSPGTHRAFAAEEPVHLTATEFRMLASLMRGRGRVRSRDDLAREAYPDGRCVSDRTIDSHVRRIREKLRPLGFDPIETIHGVGLRLRGAA